MRHAGAEVITRIAPQYDVPARREIDRALNAVRGR